MSFLFGADKFQEHAPSVSLESVNPNGEEWDMWETLKALRAQTKRRGLRAAKYRLAARRAHQG